MISIKGRATCFLNHSNTQQLAQQQPFETRTEMQTRAVIRLAFVLAVTVCAIEAMPGGYGSAGGHGGYGGATNVYQNQGYDKYNFGHDVSAPHYGNYHGRQEQGHGNAVSGTYYLKEADGSVRRVDYTATHPGGFQATVTDKHGSTHYGNTGYGDGSYAGGGNGANAY